MYEKNNRDRKNKSVKISPGIIIVGIVFLFNLLSDMGVGNLVLLVPIIFIAALGFIAFKAAKQAKKTRDEVAAARATQSNRQSPLQQSFDRAMASNSKRDAAVEEKIYATVSTAQAASQNYEDVAEASFERDKRNRIAQLDIFLKNGMIDRSEYNRLKTKYEQTSYRRGI